MKTDCEEGLILRTLNNHLPYSYKKYRYSIWIMGGLNFMFYLKNENYYVNIYIYGI